MAGQLFRAFLGAAKGARWILQLLEQCGGCVSEWRAFHRTADRGEQVRGAFQKRLNHRSGLFSTFFAAHANQGSAEREQRETDAFSLADQREKALRFHPVIAR